MVYCNTCKHLFIHDDAHLFVSELKEMMIGDPSVGWYGMDLLEAREEMLKGLEPKDVASLEEAVAYIQKDIDDTAKAAAYDYEEWRKEHPDDAAKLDAEEAQALAEEKMDLEHRKTVKKFNRS